MESSIRPQPAAVSECPSLFLDSLLQQRPFIEWNVHNWNLETFEIFLQLVCADQGRHLDHDALELEQLGSSAERLALLLRPRLRALVAGPLVVPVAGLEHRDEGPAEEHQRIETEEPARLDREAAVLVGED